MKTVIAQEVAKSAPPVTVTSWMWMSGLNINEIVAIATLVYIVLQAGYLVWKWVNEVKQKER